MKHKARISHDLLRKSAALAASIALVAALAACGGGSGSSTASTTTPSTAATSQMAETTSANAADIPSSATSASGTTVATAQAVVAAGAATVTVSGSTASSTVNCPGGGTAVYTVTGASLAEITNGTLDTGENYSLTFTDCQGELGAASVTGTMTLDVVAASSNSVTVDTATNGVVVTLPHGTVTLNGSSTIVKTVSTSGSTVTTTMQWTTPSYSVATAFNARNSTFSMTNVDITATETVTSGVLTGTTYDGTSTLSATLPNGAFSITLATEGATSYDSTGTPISGTWTLTLPNNAITLTIADGTATISVDYGADGTIDKTYTYTIASLVGDAG